MEEGGVVDINLALIVPNVFRAHSSDYKETCESITSGLIQLSVSVVVQWNWGPVFEEHDDRFALVL